MNNITTNISACETLESYMKLDSVKTKKNIGNIEGKTLCVVGFTPEAIGAIEGIDESQLYSVPNAAYANLFKKMYNTVDSAYTNDLVKNFIFNGRAGTDMLFFKAVQSYKADKKLKDIKSILIVPSEDWYTELTEGKSILLNKWESPKGRSSGAIFTADDAKEMVSKADMLISLKECNPNSNSSLTDSVSQCIDLMLACSHTVYNVYENTDWDKSTDKYATYTIANAESMHKSDNSLINNTDTTEQNIAEPGSQTVIVTESAPEAKEEVRATNNQFALTDKQKEVKMVNAVNNRTGRLLFPSSYAYYGKLGRDSNGNIFKAQEADTELFTQVAELTLNTNVSDDNYKLIVRSGGWVNLPKAKKEAMYNHNLAPSAETFETWKDRDRNTTEWWSDYTPSFCKDIATPVSLTDILKLLADATSRTSNVLFCSCENGSICHRSIVRYITSHLLQNFLNWNSVSKSNPDHVEFIKAIHNKLGTADIRVEQFRTALIDNIFTGDEAVNPIMKSFTLKSKKGNLVEIADNNDNLFNLYDYYYKKNTGHSVFEFAGDAKITELYSVLKDNITEIVNAVLKSISKKITALNGATAGMSEAKEHNSEYKPEPKPEEHTSLTEESSDNTVSKAESMAYYVSGNRPSRLFPNDKDAYSLSNYENIRNDILTDIADMYSRGFDTVITGGAQGIDQIYAWTAIKFREAIKTYNSMHTDKVIANFKVHLYKPSDNFYSFWVKESTDKNKAIFTQKVYLNLEKKCDKVISNGKTWNPDKRDEEMRNNAIALSAFRAYDTKTELKVYKDKSGKPTNSGTTKNLNACFKAKYGVKSHVLGANKSFTLQFNSIEKKFPVKIDSSIIKDILALIK